MGTPWSEIITDYAMVVIGDTRMREDLATNPALFFRRMAGWMQMSIPMLKSPPELLV